MPLNPSCCSAVDWLPCMLTTNDTGEVGWYPVGTCTIAVRVRPSTTGDKVTVPGLAGCRLVHPLLAAAGTALVVDGVPRVVVAPVEDVVPPPDRDPPQAARTTDATTNTTTTVAGRLRRRSESSAISILLAPLCPPSVTRTPDAN